MLFPIILCCDFGGYLCSNGSNTISKKIEIILFIIGAANELIKTFMKQRVGSLNTLHQEQILKKDCPNIISSYWIK